MKLIVLGIIIIGLALLFRLLGALEILFCFIPANASAIVVSKGNETADVTQGGGGIVDVIHDIPGKFLDKSPISPMDWKYVPGKEGRGILYHGLPGLHLGLQWKGVFTSLRTNKVQSTRYGKIENSTDFGLKPKDFLTKFVQFSGELSVSVLKAETLSVYGLDVEYDIIYETTYPVRAIVRLAEPNAFLSAMIAKATFAVTRKYAPEEFLTGTQSHDRQQELVDAVLEIGKEDGATEKAFGIRITEVTIRAVDPEESQRAILELASKTERENVAAISAAEARKTIRVKQAEAENLAGMLDIEVQEMLLNRVTLPTARQPGAIAVAAVQAYRDNKTVTVFAPGGNLAQMVSSLAPTAPASTGVPRPAPAPAPSAGTGTP